MLSYKINYPNSSIFGISDELKLVDRPLNATGNFF